jgi:hypothetical protein
MQGTVVFTAKEIEWRMTCNSELKLITTTPGVKYSPWKLEEVIGHHGIQSKGCPQNPWVPNTWHKMDPESAVDLLELAHNG